MAHALRIVAPYTLRAGTRHRAIHVAPEGGVGSVDIRNADDLLLKVGLGDRAAFGDLYDEVAPLVYGIARRVLRDPARAEEVSQEVFLQIWGQAERFDPSRGRARSWIAAVAHRRAVDVVRSEQASRRRTAEVGVREYLSAFDEVAETVERRELRRRVRGAIEELSEAQRQAVSLAYFGGMTYREVAEHVGSPEGTIKTRMRSAMGKLADILGVEDG